MAKVIIDTLPTGLTLYTGADTLNGVTKNGTALTTGVTFGGTTAPTVTVAATEIAAGDVIIATLDTYVSDSASITVDTDITAFHGTALIILIITIKFLLVISKKLQMLFSAVLVRM